MTDSVKWKIIRTNGTVLIGEYLGLNDNASTESCQPSVVKVAAFDLNKTVIISKSGTIHGASEDDWKWWHQSVPSRLRSLYNEGYAILLTSNQGRLTDAKGDESVEARPFERKLELIMRELDVPCSLFVACANDIYRKPRPGMWSLIASQLGVQIDSQNSLMIGDAAGRKNDHSDSDWHWALNLGVEFFTPEAYFKGEVSEQPAHRFDPSWFLSSARSSEALNQSIQFESQRQSLIIFIGLPGSGKTRYYRRSMQNLDYAHVNKHVYGTIAKCITAADGFLNQGRSVVIDDVNVNVQARKAWLSLAKIHHVRARAFQFTAGVDLCLHNDSVRALGGLKSLDPEQKQIYPRIPFLALVSCLEDPRLDEGFEDITKIDFEVGLICNSLAERDHRVMESDKIPVEWHGRTTGNLEKVLAVTPM